ncbi:MAG: hypothetical protein Q4B54_01595 [Coriobacteriales bacterium]|nr:hypothetical protein [Coriobacteriales bacterium]
MQIGITNPLREFLKWKPFPPNSEELPLFCWDANRVKIDGRVMLVLCNAANRFVCITAMRGDDWKHLDEVCRKLIIGSLLEYGFASSSIIDYFARAGAFEFTRTHGRKALGHMNSMIGLLMGQECARDEQFQADLMYYSNMLEPSKCATSDEYSKAAIRMAEDFLSLGINPFEESQPVRDFADDDFADADSDETESESDISESDDPAVNPSLSKCSLCGAETLVVLEGVPYCLDCYNKITEQEAGVPHITNDSSVLPVFSNGKVVQFAVHRMLTPPLARWCAREIVEQSSPNYEGIEVYVLANMNEDQEETLSRLWKKAQEAISKPSAKPFEPPAGIDHIANGVHMDGQAFFAEDVGWARIDEDEDGNPCMIVDGWRYDAKQFLNLFGAHVGFDLHWELHSPGDDLPTS